MGIRAFTRSVVSHAFRATAHQASLVSRSLHSNNAINRISALSVQKFGSSLYIRRDSAYSLSAVRNFARLPTNDDHDESELAENEAVVESEEVKEGEEAEVLDEIEAEEKAPGRRPSRPRKPRGPELIGIEKIPKLPIALTIDINKIAVVKKGGKTIRFAALVICGNGKGVAAIGKGKDKEVAVAIDKAIQDAHKKKNIHYFETYDNRTLFHSVVTHYKKTKFVAMPAKAGTGLQCSLNIARMCQAIGIKDIKVKLHGSTNAHNVTNGFWKALKQVMTPEKYSQMTGRVLVDLASLEGGYGRGHTTLPKIDEKLDKLF